MVIEVNHGAFQGNQSGLSGQSNHERKKKIFIFKNNKGVALQAYIIDKRIEGLNYFPSPVPERLAAHSKVFEVSSAIILEMIQRPK